MVVVLNVCLSGSNFGAKTLPVEFVPGIVERESPMRLGNELSDPVHERFPEHPSDRLVDRSQPCVGAFS